MIPLRADSPSLGHLDRGGQFGVVATAQLGNGGEASGAQERCRGGRAVATRAVHDGWPVGVELAEPVEQRRQWQVDVVAQATRDPFAGIADVNDLQAPRLDARRRPRRR